MNLFLAAASAGLITLTSSPYDYSYLAWIGLIPLFLRLNKANTFKESFKVGFQYSFWFAIFCFYWIAYVLKVYGPLPAPIALLGLIGFGLVCQPQWYLLGPLYFFLKQKGAFKDRPLGSAFGFSFAYAAIDFFMPKLFRDTPAHGLMGFEGLRQSADLIGAHGLSFVIVLVNLALVLTSFELKDRKEPSIYPTLKRMSPLVVSAFSILLALSIYGSVRFAQIREWMNKPAAHVEIAAIQGNVGDMEKLAAEAGYTQAANAIINEMISLSDRAVESPTPPHIIVWPETTYPSTFGAPSDPNQQARDKQVQDAANRWGIPLLFGGYDTQDKKDFNSLFFLNPDRSYFAYHKHVLLLFGEYIPGMEHLPWLQKMFPQIGNFGRGPGPQAIDVFLPVPKRPQNDKSKSLPLRSVKVSPMICYEALFPWFTIEAARKGTQILVNITNDSWFGPTSEPHLHLAHSAFRSIETRLPQLRSTNTGITALILPDGSTPTRAPSFQSAVYQSSVPIYLPKTTLMIMWGDWFPIFSIVMALLLIVGRDPRVRKRTGFTQYNPNL